MDYIPHFPLLPPSFFLSPFIKLHAFLFLLVYTLFCLKDWDLAFIVSRYGCCLFFIAFGLGLFVSFSLKHVLDYSCNMKWIALLSFISLLFSLTVAQDPLPWVVERIYMGGGCSAVGAPLLVSIFYFSLPLQKYPYISVFIFCFSFSLLFFIFLYFLF